MEMGEYPYNEGVEKEGGARMIDDEVKILIDKAYDHCKQILSDDKEKMKEVVAFLLEHETMSGAQFAACMAGEEIGEQSATSLFDDHDR